MHRMLPGADSIKDRGAGDAVQREDAAEIAEAGFSCRSRFRWVLRGDRGER